jgi:acetate kinase
MVVNAGSSSVKVSVVDDQHATVSIELPAGSAERAQRAVAELVEANRPFDAVGHRVVHGGALRSGPVLIDEDVSAELEALCDLAPLHQPVALAWVESVRRLLPGTPAVACFDTAFHSSLPPAASTYAIPVQWRQRWPVRRYGFHGLSHAWAATRVAELSGSDPEELRVVSCHLGAGASLAAVRGGVSVDTTMGFTPLEGLVMATRCGDLDPGLVLWLQRHTELGVDELADALEQSCGLLGLAGTDDMRVALEAEASGDDRAELGISVYLHRLRAGIAAMAAATEGLDVLVFTGGIGERSAAIRARAAAGLGFLGVDIDETANTTAQPDADIAARNAPVRTFVIQAREDLQIAREVTRLLDPNPPVRS